MANPCPSCGAEKLQKVVTRTTRPLDFHFAPNPPGKKEIMFWCQNCDEEPPDVIYDDPHRDLF